jgi:two-component sensor histidine kinase
VLISCQSPLFGQANADSLWSFQSIRADADGDHILDYKGEDVTIAGIVNIDSGLLHEHYLQTFIQNDSTGMSIFGMRIDTPLSAGDSIVARGKVARYYGLAEVRIESYEVYGSKEEPASMPLFDAVMDPEPFIGMLVEGEGVITGKGTVFNGKYLMLSPEGTDREMKIYVSNFHRLYADFNFDVLSAGDRISVKGVITEHSPDFPDNRTFKLFLRTPDDLHYIGLPSYYSRLIIGGIILMGILVFAWVMILRNRIHSKTKKIELSLKQKDLLLKEIHHRVKNNLAIVSGLIEIQSANTGNEETVSILQDSQSRIQSIALIHEKLYKTESLSGIELGVYLKDLVEAIHSTFTEYRDAVTLKFDLENVVLDTDRAVYCGLLINELVVNAFKYAFAMQKEGLLSVKIKKDDGHVMLAVSDNGPGLPRDFNPDNGESLGALLINSFAEHLQAEMTIATPEAGGTSFKFRFPYRK